MDINTMSINGQAPKNAAVQNANRKWWLEPKKTLADSVISVFKTIYENDSSRRTQYQISTRLYGNINIVGASGSAGSKVQSNTSAINDRLTYNLIQSVIDTLVSKMAKNRPKPMFLTSGGDWQLQTKAKKLEKFIDGIFYANKAQDLGIACIRDSLVKGDGVIYVFVRDNQIKYEKVPVDELSVDQAESEFSEPRQIHRTKNIDRGVLKELFPDKKSVIEICNQATTDTTGNASNVSDLISVVESWHLPSGKDAMDGKHAIVINSGELLSESYDKDYFPFAMLPWSKRLTGYWSQGLSEQLQNLQLEINKILWVIQRSMHMAGSYKVLIENGSKIVTEHLTNDIGAIIHYNDTAPQYITPPALQQEWFQHLQQCKQLGFEQAGISMLSASSVKPAGLDSGKALRTLNDIESERFLAFGKAYERFFLDLTSITISMAKDLYEELEKNGNKDDAKITYVGEKFIETIPWEDVAPEDDEFVLKAYPVSQLPDDPSGRLATIQEYAQAGYLSPRSARRLLDFPDLDQVEDLANAEEDYLNKILEDICDKGEYTPPDNFDDPQLARELALQYMAKGKLHNLDPARIDMISTFISQIDLLVEKAMPPQPDPMTPQAMPQPQPTSDLIQNVPGIGVQR